MYRCQRCGWQGEADELGSYSEFAGIYCGREVFKSWSCCPECEYDVDDTDLVEGE